MKKTANLLMIVMLTLVMINGLANAFTQVGKVTANVTTIGQLIELPRNDKYYVLTTYPSNLGHLFMTCYGSDAVTPSNTTDYDIVVNEIVPGLLTPDEIGIYDTSSGSYKFGVIGDADLGQVTFLLYK